MSTAPRTVNAYAAFEHSGEFAPWQYQSRPLGAEDVEIKITHCGVCGSDIHTLDSGWGTTTYPCVVGHEIVGEVTVAGADVKYLAVGDRVGVGAQVWACLNKDKDTPCEACAEKYDAMCDRGVYTYDSNTKTARRPTAATPMLCAGVTVFKPLKNHAKAGDRVGVIGIGGLGHLAIQFIKAIGATPIAFSRSTNKKQEILDLGAKEFYNLSDPEGAAKAVSSVSVLIITADATNMPYDTYLDLLRPRGTCVMLGLPNDKVQFNPWSLLGKDKKFVGSLIGSAQDIKDMLAVASEKNVRTIIQKMPMAQVNEAIQMVRNGKARYRIVLEN